LIADREMLAWLRAGEARNADGASVAAPPVEGELPGSPLEHPRPAPARNGRKSSLGRLCAELLRPHRGSLAIILFATVLETAMSLAAPWPLKIVLDNVIAGHHAPGWLRDAARWVQGDGAVGIAAVAGIAVGSPETAQAAAFERWVSLAGTGHSDFTDVSGDKYKHLAAV